MKGKGITERGRLTAALAVTLIVAVVCFFSLNSFSFGATSEKSGKSSSNKVSTTDSSGGNDGKETVYIMQKANGNEYKRVVSDEGNLKYKGYDDAQLPVTMKVSYTLDGKAISPADLAGESGHVKIHITYTNNIKRNNVYVPFAVMTAFIFDNDDFSNVSVDNGKVIDDGTRNTVVGYALPGLSESLSLNLSELDSGAKDIDIPESVTIECDTTKYNVENAYSVVTDEMFQDIDMSDVNNASDLKDKMDEVKSAAKKLANGTSQLSNGADKVASGAGKLSAASKTIKNGAKDVASGTNLLKSKTPALTGGISKLAAGSKQVSDGNAALLAGLQKMYGTAPTKADLSDGSGTQKLAAGAKALNSEVQALNLSKVSLTEEQKTKIQTAAASKVTGAATQLSTGIGAGVAGKLKSTISADSAKSTTVSKVLADENIQKAVKALEAAGYTEAEAKAVFSGVVSTTLDGAASQISADAVTGSISGNVESTVQQVAGAAAVSGAQGVVDETNKTIEGYSGKITALKSATKQLQEGTEEVNVGLAGKDGKGEGEDNLIGASKELADGSSEVYSGITALQGGSKELVSGVNKLASGSMQLYNGTVIFSSKEAELASGAAALAKGAKTLDKSVDSAMNEAKSEIDKLNASNLLDVVDNAKAIQNAAQNYNSFGNTKTYKSVTFIYKMDEVSPK
ncbi:hypothetical protein [Hornefia butyriciproducens]|uniref:hypothetical protein n=1 Tax=Hornefia butyriciproducens TaxID=2652293 RepID=UPI0023F2C2BF|nr:hypothetical protein [Hornefia butyriciproducens]MDD6299075.1 hypothetical protein [Hornefia butyriciproducens]